MTDTSESDDASAFALQIEEALLEQPGDERGDEPGDERGDEPGDEPGVQRADEPFVEAQSSAPAASPSIAIPDRADAPVSETTERFLRAITAVVPVDRIEELHLFSPLRQGGVETGIAVIAARVVAPVPAPAATPVVAPLVLALEAGTEEAHAADAPAVSDGAPTAAHTPQDADKAAVGEVAVDAAVGAALADVAIIEATIDRVTDVQPAIDARVPDESPYAPEVVHEIVEHAVEDTRVLVTEVIASEHALAAPVERHTVYTARYRLVQKGPERGKWETDVRDEADAPLITVEMVVRGVQRRAGESSGTTRYTGAQIARALGR